MKNDVLKIISLGGFGDVTQNMYLYHLLPNGEEKNDQILIVDVGIGFPDESALGVDMIIPDFSYLMDRKEKVVGLLLTHGHEDHIGALPLFLSQFKRPIKIYGAPLTLGFAQDKVKEFGIPIKSQAIGPNDRISLGSFNIEPIQVTHSIPDTYHYLINTPIGNFYHGSDFKFDLTPPDGKKSDFAKISTIGQRGVMAALVDCLGADRDGFSPSESDLDDVFERQIKTAKGRIFITAISSNIYRWQRAITFSRQRGRRICLVGMSVEKKIKLSQQMGYLNMDDSQLVDVKKINQLPDDQVTVLIGGSLGQAGSSLSKVVSGRHRIKVKTTDRYVISSPDYIPGTSKGIYKMIDNLAKMGAEVVYGEADEPLHVSGHASRQELSLLLTLIKPKFITPIGGNYRHIRKFTGLVKEAGFPKDSFIFPEEDQVLSFTRSGLMKTKERLKLRRILVDGLGVGDVGKTVLRDRRLLAKEGIITIVLVYDREKKDLLLKPEVVSRGFVYVKENSRLIGDIAQIAKDSFSRSFSEKGNIGFTRSTIQSRIEEYVLKETGRQPMVIPLIVKV